MPPKVFWVFRVFTTCWIRFYVQGLGFHVRRFWVWDLGFRGVLETTFISRRQPGRHPKIKKALALRSLNALPRAAPPSWPQYYVIYVPQCALERKNCTILSYFLTNPIPWPLSTIHQIARSAGVGDDYDHSRPPDNRTLGETPCSETGQTKPRQNPTGFPRVQGERQFNTIGFNASRICLGDQHPVLVPELYQGNPLDMPREQKETWFPEVSCRCSLNPTISTMERPGYLGRPWGL